MLEPSSQLGFQGLGFQLSSPLTGKPSFISSVWSGVCSSLWILASTMTSFHPQSNGMIQLFHRSLKSAVFSRLAGSDWFLRLPLVLLGLRTVPKDDTGLSVSEAVYGSPLTVPGEFPGSCIPPPTLARSSKLWLVLPFLRLIMFQSLRLVSSQLPCCQQSLCLFKRMPLLPL